MTVGRDPADPPERPRPAAPRAGSPWSELAAGQPFRPSTGIEASDRNSGSTDATAPWTPVAPPRRVAAIDATRVMPVVPATGAPPSAVTDRTAALASPGRRDVGSTVAAPVGSDRGSDASRPALIGRFVVSLAGLLAAGCLLLGVALVILQIAAPRLGGTGLEVATGPGWPAAVTTLAVGVLGEVGYWLTLRSSRVLRIAVSTVVVLAVFAVLAFVWWR